MNDMTNDPVANSLAELVSEVKGIGDVRQDIAVLREHLSEMEQKQARQLDAMDARMQRRQTMGAGSYGTIGEQVTRAEQFKSWVAGGALGKARVMTKAVDAESAPQHLPQIAELERRPITLRDLLRVQATDAGSITYVQQDSRDLLAAVVAPGALKPESSMAFTMKEAQARTIAHWITVSRQALDDGGRSLQAAIDNDLRFGLQIASEGQILNGDGTGQNLFGLVPQATAYDTARTVAGNTSIDIIAHALSQIVESTGISASGVVLHPADWAAMAGAKATDGTYLAGSPFTAGPRSIWGVPVALTPTLAEGSFLVGNFGMAATLFERMGVEIVVSADHADYFVKNLLAVRAEERIALAVTAPALLVTGAFA